jgi:hypothetical protein
MRKKMFYVIAVLGLMTITACDPRAVAASLNKPERHDFADVVCFTYSTSISCVKK